jgi:hypothetical protein
MSDSAATGVKYHAVFVPDGSPPVITETDDLPAALAALGTSLSGEQRGWAYLFKGERIYLTGGERPFALTPDGPALPLLHEPAPEQIAPSGRVGDDKADPAYAALTPSFSSPPETP